MVPTFIFEKFNCLGKEEAMTRKRAEAPQKKKNKLTK
jgi:hypothetical protein